MERKVDLERNKVFFSFGKFNGNVWHLQCSNTRKKKCTMKLHEMNGYSQVDLLIGLIGNYNQKEWYIML